MFIRQALGGMHGWMKLTGMNYAKGGARSGTEIR